MKKEKYKIVKINLNIKSFQKLNLFCAIKNTSIKKFIEKTITEKIKCLDLK